MLMSPAEKTGLFKTLGNAFILWWQTLPAALPLSILSALLANNMLFAKYLWSPAYIGHAFYWIVSVALSFISLIFFNGLLAFIGHRAHDKDLGFGKAISLGIKRWGRVIWGHFLYMLMLFGMGVAVLIVTLVVFGILYFTHVPMSVMKALIIAISLFLYAPLIIWLVVKMAVYSVLMVNKDMPAIKAIRESFRLVKNHWWYSAATVAVVFIVSMPLQWAIHHFINPLAAIIPSIIFTSLYACLVVLLLDQLNIRHHA